MLPKDMERINTRSIRALGMLLAALLDQFDQRNIKIILDQRCTRRSTSRARLTAIKDADVDPFACKAMSNQRAADARANYGHFAFDIVG